MNIELTAKEFRRLLDLVYIGNWVLNSTRGDDRFADYDDLESKIFALSPALSEVWNGTIVPSRAYTEGGIRGAFPAGYGLPRDQRRELRRDCGAHGQIYVGI